MCSTFAKIGFSYLVWSQAVSRVSDASDKLRDLIHASQGTGRRPPKLSCARELCTRAVVAFVPQVSRAQGKVDHQSNPECSAEEVDLDSYLRPPVDDPTPFVVTPRFRVILCRLNKKTQMAVESCQCCPADKNAASLESENLTHSQILRGRQTFSLLLTRLNDSPNLSPPTLPPSRCKERKPGVTDPKKCPISLKREIDGRLADLTHNATQYNPLFSRHNNTMIVSHYIRSIHT